MNKTFAPENSIGPVPVWLRGMRPAFLLLALAGSCLCCHGQLPTDLVLPSETLDSGNLTFQASDSITNSGSNFVVQDPASVTLTAGSYIKLEPGFDATAGAAFHAVIDPNVVNWQPIPVPAPPTPCTSCGEDYIDGSSGTNPQFIFAPNTGNNTVYVGCQNVYYPYNLVQCNITVSTTAYLNTNGHFHSNPPPPFSTISPTSGNTGNCDTCSGLEMQVTVTTKQVGQIERLSMVDNDTGNVNYVDFAVGYDSLVYLGNSNIFAQIGGDTTGHGDNTWNHWMTVNAATGLQQAATAYINQNNPGQKICINDMALPIGGIFDICWQAYQGCKAVNPWGSPHVSHDLGTAADVAVSSLQCTRISPNYIVNQDLFLDACKATTGSLKANTIPENSHVHCRWQN